MLIFIGSNFSAKRSDHLKRRGHASIKKLWILQNSQTRNVPDADLIGSAFHRMELRGRERRRRAADLSERAGAKESNALQNQAAMRSTYTAIGAFIEGCGSYPTSSKSSNLKSQIFLMAGFNFIRGSGRHSRESCSRAWARWFL